MQLDRIAAELARHPAFGAASGPKLSDKSYRENWDKLDRCAAELARLAQQIDNHRNLLEMRSQVAWRVPRERRYSYLQSIGDQQRGLEPIYAKAVNLLDLLRDMTDRYGRPDINQDDRRRRQGRHEAGQGDPGAAQGARSGRWTPARSWPQGVPLPFILVLIVVYLRRIEAGARAVGAGGCLKKRPWLPTKQFLKRWPPIDSCAWTAGDKDPRWACG